MSAVFTSRLLAGIIYTERNVMSEDERGAGHDEGEGTVLLALILRPGRDEPNRAGGRAAALR